MLKNKRIQWVIAIFCSLALNVTQAQNTDSKIYVGTEIIATKVNKFGSGFGAGSYIGYELHKNFSIEASYQYLGKFNYDDFPVEMKALQVSGIGRYEITPVCSAFIRLGFIQPTATVKNSAFSKSATALVAGLGAAYKLTDDLQIQGEYRNLSNLAHQFSIGFNFKF